MKTLGLSFDFHDAAAAIVDDGLLVAASGEERFSLQKHDSSYPAFAVENILRQCELESAELDRVVFYEEPYEKFTRVLDSSFKRFPLGVSQFRRSMNKWLSSSLWKRNIIANELGVSPGKIEFFPHHYSHIAQAFGPSSFTESAVLIIDAVGEWSTTTLAHASNASGKLEIKIFESYEYPNSIGLVYAAFTAFLGFKPNSGESSTMALAAYGAPRYTDLIEKVISRNQDNTYSVASGYFNFDEDSSRLFTQKFLSLFNDPRDMSQAYTFNALNPNKRDKIDQRFADIAASLQCVLEDIILGLCSRLLKYTHSSNLCFAGGVALNCLANSRLISAESFQNIFIPCDPGDGGAATGAAYLGNVLQPTPVLIGPYLGTHPGLKFVEDIFSEEFLNTLGVSSQNFPCGSVNAIKVREFDDDNQLMSLIAQEIHNGKIIGWVQGRFEFGPRALGNRSLLVDPSNLSAIRRMSEFVKRHATFRPYALSMQHEFAESIIKCDHLGQTPLKWMQSTWPVREKYAAILRGGMHVDGTTRPHLCVRSENERFWKLLNCYFEVSGCPAILNTSFNERGMPMVSNSLQAILTFLRTAIDILVVDNFVIRKS